VESFHVVVFYEGVMPITVVHYTLEADEDEARKHNPSTAVVCIRKYLEEKLRGHPAVEFASLGPSPFWADVFLTDIDSSKPPAEDVSLPGDGYRTIVIRLDSDTPDEKITEFIVEYEPVLSAFYQSMLVQRHSETLRTKVTEGAQRLLEARSNGNTWAKLGRWRRFSEEIDRVYSALLSEKMFRATVQGFVSNLHQDETVPPDNVFYPFVERQMEHRADVPDEDIRELLVMLEERRRSHFQNAATLFSGLAGGVLGAVIGASATFMLNGSHTPAPVPSEHVEQTSGTSPVSSLPLKPTPAQ
jgi:hypothetical protein